MKTALFLIMIFVLVMCIVPWILMNCWNYVMPHLFGLKTINYLQSAALFVVFSLLFHGTGARAK